MNAVDRQPYIDHYPGIKIRGIKKISDPVPAAFQPYDITDKLGDVNIIHDFCQAEMPWNRVCGITP